MQLVPGGVRVQTECLYPISEAQTNSVHFPIFFYYHFLLNSYPVYFYLLTTLIKHTHKLRIPVPSLVPQQIISWRSFLAIHSSCFSWLCFSLLLLRPNLSEMYFCAFKCKIKSMGQNTFWKILPLGLWFAYRNNWGSVFQTLANHSLYNMLQIFHNQNGLLFLKSQWGTDSTTVHKWRAVPCPLAGRCSHVTCWANEMPVLPISVTSTWERLIASVVSLPLSPSASWLGKLESKWRHQTEPPCRWPAPRVTHTCCGLCMSKKNTFFAPSHWDFFFPHNIPTSSWVIVSKKQRGCFDECKHLKSSVDDKGYLWLISATSFCILYWLHDFNKETNKWF